MTDVNDIARRLFGADYLAALNGMVRAHTAADGIVDLVGQGIDYRPTLLDNDGKTARDRAIQQVADAYDLLQIAIGNHRRAWRGGWEANSRAAVRVTNDPRAAVAYALSREQLEDELGSDDVWGA